MLKPLSERVVLQKVKEEEKTVGGLLLAASAKVANNVATVVAVADEVTSVKVGDVVVFDAFAGTELAHEGQDYTIVEVKNILAILA